MKPSVDQLAKIMLMDKDDCEHCIYSCTMKWGDLRCSYPDDIRRIPEELKRCDKFEWEEFYRAEDLLQDSQRSSSPS